MKAIASFLLAAAFLPALAVAQQPALGTFDWKKLADAGQLKTGTVVELPGGGTALQIENAGPQPLVATVLTIDSPKLTKTFYTVTGDVRCEGVEGDGILEMWNHFSDGGPYFSRTMGEEGPMAKLRGTADWRGFVLPFNSTGAKGTVSKLVINVHLPAKGTVWLRSPLTLAEPATGAAFTAPGAWWSDRTSGLVGGIGGGAIGCFAGLLGWFSARGKVLGFVTAGASVLLGLGVISFGAAIFALGAHQPYGVWYPLVLIGVILLVTGPILFLRTRRTHREHELRRMASLDAV